ncbi:MAG: hypothetical protein CFH44_00246 [Proteobacteria bacterium]|nr:MAG: hypothetical protein CFH44_00246 [Pseudomonadota bacterium]|tara:strand:+ start:2184 stop:2531 length:348 start_codon:yes stop_codon:yes gene_type:complete
MCELISDELLNAARKVVSNEENGVKLKFFKIEPHADYQPISNKEIELIKLEFENLYNPYNVLGRETQRAIKLISNILVSAENTCYTCTMQMYYKVKGYDYMTEKSILNSSLILTN